MDLAECQRLARAGRWAEAAALCKPLLDAHPDDPQAWNLMGSILFGAGRIEEALGAMTRAVELNPRSAKYRVNLAAALGEAGRPKDAVPHLNEAARLDPNVPELWNNAGVTLEKLGRYREATERYEKALSLRPDFADAQFNLGNALRKQGRGAAAVEAYRRALKLVPDRVNALSALAWVLPGLGDSDEEIECFKAIVRLRPNTAAARSALLYTIHYSPDYDAEAIYREHREWGRLFCDPLQGSIPAHENDRDPDRRLRVGYVSPDLREHTVTKFISAAIKHHDRERFEVSCYSDAERPDHVSERLKGWAEHWHDTRGLSTTAMERLIREHRIDILVDLRGHGADNRLLLFARKPAPLQMNMVGYFNTTGLGAMTHRIADRHMDPPGTERLNTEQLVRIEPSRWCYSPEPDAPPVAESPVLKNGYVTFGSLNKAVKVSEPCAKLWARVLEATPGSKLLLTAPAEAEASVRQRLARLGLPADRLILREKTRTSREYLERYGEIDIVLDTLPFGGMTVTCDGLWMGVPCVSLAGGTTASRAGKSILHAANLPDLATETEDQFVAIACGLARDVDRLCTLRMGMRGRLGDSALLDHPGFARKLEAAYRRMWQAWCFG